jgi:predicted nucleic acid-binding protein
VIFVDSSAWFARFTPKDRNHSAATRFQAQTREKFVTSDYIIDEVLTLLKVRGNVGRATRVGKALFEGNLAQIE